MAGIDTLDACIPAESTSAEWYWASDPDRIDGGTFSAAAMAKTIEGMQSWRGIVLGLTSDGLPAATIETRGKHLAMDAYWEGQIRNRPRVVAALERTPRMHGLLIKVQDRLAELFGDGRIILEGASDEGQVHVVVETRLPVGEASDILRKFDEEWWLENMAEAHGNLSVVLDFIQ